MASRVRDEKWRRAAREELARREASRLDASQRAALHLAHRKTARHSLVHFCTYVNPLYRVNWHHRVICRHVMRWLRGEIQNLAIFSPPRHGKALALDTPIPTLSGWTTIGEIKVGDLVFSDTGKPCRVVAVSPVWEGRPSWRVIDDVGAEVVADGSHLWRVRLDRKHKAYTLRNTGYLAARTSPRRPLIDRSGPLNLPDADLLVDPYVLGVWLGDGCSQHATITQGTGDIDEVRRLVEAGGYATSDRATRNTFGVLGLNHQLRFLGLLNNKRVPAEYLRGSIAQRRALLQGLIDTDGHVAPDGQVEFCSTDKGLAGSVRELVTSLGVKASMIHGRAVLDGIDHGPKFRVMFYMADAARLTRKRDRCRDSTKQPGHYVEFSDAGPADTVCIQVDSPSSMFLAGRGMIPTHNSEIVSRHLPAFAFGQDPDVAVMGCSHTQTLASTMNRSVQRIMDSKAYRAVFPGVRLWGKDCKGEEPRLRTAEEFEVVGHRGYYRCAGVGGSIVGRGFNRGIIDDPVKSRAEAVSPTYRKMTKGWYTDDFRTRKEDDRAGILLTLTRWHDDDLAGWLLEVAKNEEADQWTILVLPAICNRTGEYDYDPRQEGEALWPERFSIKSLKQTRATVDPYSWLSIYQQTPARDTGTVFNSDTFRSFTPLRTTRGIAFKRDRAAFEVEDPPLVMARDCNWFQTVDTAMSVEDSADYTVVATWALSKEGHLFLWHVWRERVEVMNQFPALLKLRQGAMPPLRGVGFNDWKLHTPPPWPKALLFQSVEQASSGIGLIQTGRAAGNAFRPLKADKNKVLRAANVLAMLENGMVYFRSQAAWLPEYVHELTRFPGGQNDDQVDVTSYAGMLAAEDKILRAAVEGPLAYEDLNAQGPRTKIRVPGGDLDIEFPDEEEDDHP